MASSSSCGREKRRAGGKLRHLEAGEHQCARAQHGSMVLAAVIARSLVHGHGTVALRMSTQRADKQSATCWRASLGSMFKVADVMQMNVSARRA